MTDMQQPGDAKEIRALTSLRGAAALAVVTQHFSATAQLHSSGWIPSIVPHGYMAVDFFFVLSGFIMSYTYLTAFQAEGMRAFLPFFMKRIARIVPLGLAMLAVILLLGAIASLWGRADMFINPVSVQFGLARAVVVNILHLQGLLTRYNLNDPSWSISVELVAYLLFPVFITVVSNAPRLAALGLMLVGMSVLGAVAVMQPRLSLAVRSVPLDLLRCFVEFGLGMFAYRLFQARGRMRAIGSDGSTWGITAFSVAMLVLRLDLFAAFSFPLLVLAWARNTGAASRIMSSRVMYFLGMISFSIYLTHQVFRRPELELLQHFFPEPVSPAWALAFAFAGSITVLPTAVLAYYFVERPGRIAVNRLVKRLRRPSEALT